MPWNPSCARVRVVTIYHTSIISHDPIGFSFDLEISPAPTSYPPAVTAPHNSGESKQLYSAVRIFYYYSTKSRQIIHRQTWSPPPSSSSSHSSSFPPFPLFFFLSPPLSLKFPFPFQQRTHSLTSLHSTPRKTQRQSFFNTSCASTEEQKRTSKP